MKITSRGCSWLVTSDALRSASTSFRSILYPLFVFSQTAMLESYVSSRFLA